jgi:uncharacterized protein (DUF305 family)
VRRTSFLSVAALFAVSLAVTFFLTRPGSIPPNEDDKHFVEQLIPHHHLGMRLLDEATLRSNDVRLRRLVFEMGTYHADELLALEQWSEEWGLSTAEDFPGSLSEVELQHLSTLTSAAHDTYWLALMIRHHEGALTISNNNAVGRRTESMATSVANVQRQQIADMRALLADLCNDDASLTGCDYVPAGQ